LEVLDRRLNRDIRFAHRQQLTHEWVPFSSIIELWGERAVDFLRADLGAGRLPHVLFVHFDFKLCWIRRQSEPVIRSEVFERFWVPRADFVSWCKRWNLPIDQAAGFAGEIPEAPLAPIASVAPVAVPPVAAVAPVAPVAPVTPTPPVADATVVAQPSTEPPQLERRNQPKRRNTWETRTVLAALKEPFGVKMDDDDDTIKQKTADVTTNQLEDVVGAYCKSKNQLRYPDRSTIERVTGRRPRNS
jgi:hypothetical protein